jgi:hypothetical protein
MTAQFHDTILINEKEYSIVGVNGSELFNPKSIGIKPVPYISACWRGYICQYKIGDDKLILEKLQLSFGIYEGHGKRRKFIYQKSPAINGVNPHEPRVKYPTLNNVYEGLNLEIQYNGGILAGDGFIQKLYVHMGFHPAWKYQTVFELMFDNGKVRDIYNVSEQMEIIRNKMSGLPLEPDFSKASIEEIEAWIKMTFSLNYDL